MARVDFAFGAPDRLRTACEVAHKHVKAGHVVLVYSRDADLLGRFDAQLWGLEPTAFIPHAYADDPLAAQAPVVMTTELPGLTPDRQNGAWLLNLDLDCPSDTGKFDRILEIVSTDESDIQQARQRWKAYKSAGHDVHAHDLTQRR